MDFFSCTNMTSDNKEDRRKCFKCGSSPAENSEITLFRFPKPGKTNILRCEIWAKYCYPEGQWSAQDFQKKLHSQHIMLCNKHFKKTSFSDYPVSSKKLHRFAFPEDEIINKEVNEDPEQPHTSRSVCVVKAVVVPSLTETPAHANVPDEISKEQKAKKRKAENAENQCKSILVGVVKTVTGPLNVEPLALNDVTDIINIESEAKKRKTDDTEQQYTTSAAGAMEVVPGPSNAGPVSVSNVTSVTPKCRKRTAENTEERHTSSSVAGAPHVVFQTLADITNIIDLEPKAKKTKTEVARPIDGTKANDTIKISGCKEKVKKKKDKISECDLHENMQYQRCHNLLKRICQLRNKIYRLKNKKLLKELSENDCIQKISRKLTPTFSRLLQGQIKNFKKKATGRRWTTEEKIVALRLFKRSPTCYRLLRRLFCLPAPSTLKIILRKFPLRVGVNKEVLNVLKKFVKTQVPSDNQYILSFDEMSIRKNIQYNQHDDTIEGFQDHGVQGKTSEIASHALVFMVAGIRKKIKQPIAYYLSGSYVTADRLAVLIKEVIRQCFSIGLNVSATVCDMDGVNRRALSILGATKDSPTISIDNKEIVTLYDPPHLLKCFRNLFLKYNLKCPVNISGDSSGRGIAKWEHIRAFYESDNNNPNFVFAPCLKEDHINPNNKQKMKVKLAAQVLSHSVAAGMYAKISQGELTTEAVVTANVVSNIDKLFDTLNSDSSDLRRGKPFATNLKNKSPHLPFLKKMKNFFRNLEFVGARAAPPSKDGWIWTINGIEKLWNNLTRKHPDIQSLATRRLQQDPLENLFGCIRSNCGDNCNPTVGQFIAGLKTAILGNLPHIGTSTNCEEDRNKMILDNYKKIFTSNKSKQNIDDNHITINFDSNEIERLVSQVTEATDSEMQACAYVTGFIYRELNVECDTCKENLLSKEPLLAHTFVENKEYHENKKKLNYMSETFIMCVEECATMSNNYLKKNAHINNIKLKITELVGEKVNFDFLKSCNLHFIKNKLKIVESVFFICVKRFCVTQNRLFANEASENSLRKKKKILAHK